MENAKSRLIILVIGTGDISLFFFKFTYVLGIFLFVNSFIFCLIINYNKTDKKNANLNVANEPLSIESRKY